MDTKKLLHKINKFFKSEKLIAELFLENYEEFNIYFRIGYNKKRKCYRLSWFDLNLMETNDVEKYLSFEYIPDQIIEHITNFIETIFNFDFFSVCGFHVEHHPLWLWSFLIFENSITHKTYLVK